MKKSNLIWGILLILASAILLVERLGYLDMDAIADNTWVLILGGAGVFFLAVYLISGISQWGWLFPSLVCAGSALTVWMATHGMDGAFLGAPVPAAIAIPFIVGFLVNRKKWGLLIPAWVMIVSALITLLADQVRGELVGAFVLLSIALPFLIVFLVNHTLKWALIPAWALFVLGIITLLSNHASGNLVGALFMFSVALAFLVVYLIYRTQRWALIPAAICAVIGTFPLIATLFQGDLLGAVVMFLFALPFFIIIFRWKEAWWAIIPAGIFASIFLVVVMAMIVPKNQEIWEGILTGILLLGFATTFGYLWLRRKSLPTDWAKFPAIGLLTAAALAFILGRNFQEYWEVVLLIVGILLVVTSLLPGPKSPPPAISE